MSDYSGAVSAAGDDEILTLEALRARLARAIDDDNTSARDLAPLTRRLQEVIDRLREARALAEDAERAGEAAEEALDDAFDPESL